MTKRFFQAASYRAELRSTGPCHAWSSDPVGQAEIRAAEDGRDGPLPTLEKAISAVTERRPPEPEGGGNVTGQCASPADTGANTGDRDFRRKQWEEAVGIICDGGSWGRGNSFDVAKIGGLMIWADKEMRETVGLRSMLAAAEANNARLKAELDELKGIIVASESAPAASVVTSVVSDMTDIIRGNATDDEKHAALATLVEAVCTLLESQVWGVAVDDK